MAMDNKIIERLKNELNGVVFSDDLKSLWKKYLGKEGEVKLALKEIAKMSPEEKSVQGTIIQEIYKETIALFEEKEKALQQGENDKNLKQSAENLGYEIVKVGSSSSFPATKPGIPG